MAGKMNHGSGIFSEGLCINLDTLKAYKNRALSREKVYLVEKHLVDCPLCSAALDGLENIDDLKSAKKDIEEIEKAIIYKINSKRRNSNWKYFAIAASLVFLFFTYWMLYQNKDSAIEIFNSHFTMYPNLTPITRSEAHESSFLSAMQQYELQNYLKSRIFLKSIPDQDKYYTAARFYLGVISLKDENLTDAERHLSYVIASNDSTYVEPSLWYLALIYIKSGKLDESKNLLKKLINDNTSYKAKSKTILELINNSEVLH